MKSKKLIAKIVSIVFLFSIIVLPIEVFALSPSSSTIYQGIDVSQWQGAIDYRKVKNDGIKIVYIKASEGTTYVDPYFTRNYENAKRNGLKVGFYHYVRARSVEAAKQEAEHFAKVIQGKRADCRLAMDFESFGSLSNRQVNSISKAFLEKVYQLTKKNLVVYSNTYSARTVFSKEIANKYPLWVAQYGPSQPSNNGKWNSWIGFQYTSTGIVNGVNGRVDRDKFTKEILLKDTGKIPTVPGSNINEGNSKNIRYTVKRGDTLSEIAQKYRTTVSKIARDNNISNVNKIYVGQILKIEQKSKPENTSTERIRYTVKRGDTLSEIAQKYRTTVSKIAKDNNISNINKIYIGQKLIITTEQSKGIHDCGHCIYTVKRGDTLSEIAKRYKTTVNSIVKINTIKNKNKIYVGEQLRIEGKCNCK